MGKLLFALVCLLMFTVMISATGTYNNQFPGDSPIQTDGPYVNYTEGHVSVSYILEKNGKKRVESENMATEMKGSLRLTVATDIPGKLLQFRLKRSLKNEKSEFPAVRKLLVLSDIEGQFTAFRKLLESAGVIDQNFDWTFGDGNLVLVGDFFDRGEHVTEVLWLIYSLEEKAKAAGGYVHFVLGNHEIMNLTGDLRYTKQKYLDNAKLITGDYLSLYDENSELGRWLRTKNIIEKIGDLLFVHGGISGSIIGLNESLNGINLLARPYYGDDSFRSNDEKLNTIFSDLGPFWYRGYYNKTGTSVPLQINSALTQFGVKRIITGHTIVADTISTLYNGKLIDVDVHHAGGKSEALLIDSEMYYRISPEGKKVLLMEEGK